MRYIPIIFACCILAGCGEREQMMANAGASIWEAADCIEKGGPVGPCVKILKIQAKAIIISQGHTYKPAGIEEETEK